LTEDAVQGIFQPRLEAVLLAKKFQVLKVVPCVVLPGCIPVRIVKT
jgi:hypothetical protein